MSRDSHVTVWWKKIGPGGLAVKYSFLGLEAVRLTLYLHPVHLVLFHWTNCSSASCFVALVLFWTPICVFVLVKLFSQLNSWHFCSFCVKCTLKSPVHCQKSKTLCSRIIGLSVPSWFVALNLTLHLVFLRLR